MRVAPALRPLLALTLLLTSACEGVLSSTGTEGPGPRPMGDAGPLPPGTDAQVPPGVDGGPPPIPSPYPNATVGARCAGGALTEHLVLSTAPADCTAHARALTGAAEPSESIAIALSGMSPQRVTRTVCVGGSCRDAELTLEVTVDESGASGWWSMDIEGQARRFPFTATRCDFESAAPSTSPVPVGDVAISELSITQGVEVVLMEGGTATSLPANAPLVAGRDALLRIFMAPEAGAPQREIVARVQLGDGAPLEARQVIGSSSRGSLASTLNVQIPGDRMVPGAALRVELVETAPGCAPAEPVAGASFPGTGTQPLGIESNGDTFRIVLVPVRYDADGSGRLPVTDGAMVTAFRDLAYSMFPVRDVEVTVSSRALAWPNGVGADGAGWSALLNACRDFRNGDAHDADTYYYCLFAPAGSFREFCSRGCTAGLGFVPSSRDESARVSIGLGYRGSEDTFVHEVGHTLGRPHAPCGGVAGAEESFPYPGGGIGAWGFDMVRGELRDPADYRDLMGYCNPAWISDYAYGRIFDRIQTIRSATVRGLDEPMRARAVIVDVDGSLSWGAETLFHTEPDGEPITATWDSPDGTRRTVVGTLSRVSDVPGGVIYVPVPDAPATRLDLGVLGSLAME